MKDYDFMKEHNHFEANPLKRGSKVKFKGNDEFSPENTYVWTVTFHKMIRIVVQHKDGFPKSHFIQDYLEGRFPDGFEAVHSSELDDNFKYIYVMPSELELVNQ